MRFLLHVAHRDPALLQTRTHMARKPAAVRAMAAAAVADGNPNLWLRHFVVWLALTAAIFHPALAAHHAAVPARLKLELHETAVAVGEMACVASVVVQELALTLLGSAHRAALENVNWQVLCDRSTSVCTCNRLFVCFIACAGPRRKGGCIAWTCGTRADH